MTRISYIAELQLSGLSWNMIEENLNMQLTFVLL